MQIRFVWNIAPPEDVTKFDWFKGRTVRDEGTFDSGRYHIWRDMTSNEMVKTFEVVLHDELSPVPPYKDMGLDDTMQRIYIFY